MKLSKAQAKVINEAKEKIDRARRSTIIEWAAHKLEYDDEEKVKRVINCYLRIDDTPEQAQAKIDQEIARYAENYKKYYENEKNGIVLTCCNGRTLKKLEELGLIEILYDSSNTHFTIDTIKLLNY